MEDLEIEEPSEYQLDLLKQRYSDDWNWELHEYVPYVDEPEVRRHQTSEIGEAYRLIHDISFNPQVASRISYVKIQGTIDENLREELEE